jgi:hypothetical protein
VAACAARDEPLIAMVGLVTDVADLEGCTRGELIDLKTPVRDTARGDTELLDDVAVPFSLRAPRGADARRASS